MRKSGSSRPKGFVGRFLPCTVLNWYCGHESHESVSFNNAAPPLEEGKSKTYVFFYIVFMT